MKFNIEDVLYNLDQSLSQKSDRDKTMLFIMIFASLVAFSYLLLWESAETNFNSSHEKAMQMSTDLNFDKQYLDANPPERIAQIEAETAAIEKQHSHYIHYNTYIKEQIDQISYLYYDAKVWGAYLDSVSRYARANKVKLVRFGNTWQMDNNSFGHVLDISISSEAPYKNALKFINALEQSYLVVDLHDFNMSVDDKFRGDFNISVWGIVRQ